MNNPQRTMAMIGAQLHAAQTTHVPLIKWAKTQAEIILDVQKEMGINKYARHDSNGTLPAHWIFTSVVEHHNFYDVENPYVIYCEGYKNTGQIDLMFYDVEQVINFVLHPLIVAGDTVGYEKTFRAELVEYADRNLR